MKHKIPLPLKRDSFWKPLILLAVIAVFLPAVQNQTPLIDDLYYIMQARRPFSDWHSLFDPVLGLRTPLAALSFRLDWIFFGEKYFFTAAHLENILFHALSCVIFYQLLRILRWKRENGLYLRLSPVWSGLAALIFGCHPQRVESVAWLAERKDVLAMLFGISALFFFYRALKKERVSIAAPLLLLFSLAAKPMWLFFIVPAAALVWMEERRFELKKWLRLLSLILLVTGLYFALHFQLFSSTIMLAGTGNSRSFALKGEIILHNYGLYFLKTLTPGSLFPIYPFYHPAYDQRWICAVPLLLLLVPLLALKRELRQGVLFGWVPALAAFAAVLIPTVGFTQVGNTDFADRYSYLPALMVLTPLVMQLKLIPRRSALGAWLPVLAVLYLAGMICQTEKHLPVWRTQKSFYQAVLHSSHPNCHAVIYQANQLLLQKKFQESETLLREKLKPSPYDTREDQKMVQLYPFVHQGTVLFMTGNPDEGIKYYNTYYMSPDWFCLKPCSAALLQKVFSWGAAYHLRKFRDVNAAENLYLRCAEIMKFRDIHYYHFYRGMAKVVKADYAGAIPCFEQALAAAPYEKRCRQNLEYCRRKSMRKTENE